MEPISSASSTLDKQAIEFKEISKQYRKTLPLLSSISFSVNYSQIVAIVGPSGSGKSTILRMAAQLVSPDSGSLLIDGQQIFPKSRNNVSTLNLRNELLSYVSQDDFLLETLSVFENVSLALELNSKCPNEKKVERVLETLDVLGIKGLADRRISDISAGERKRVAISRSFVTNPRILIADEPTSSLDLEKTNEFLKLVRKKVDEKKMALLLASHDVVELKSVTDKIYSIKNYVLSEIGG